MIKNKTLLVLSAFPDLETDLVLAKLKNKGIAYTRINTFRLSDYSFTYDYADHLSLTHLPFSEENISAIWNRMPFTLRGMIVPDNYNFENDFLHEEQYWFIRNLGEHLPPTRWVNHPSLEERANCKLLQLRQAKNANLPIPDTIITNDKHKLKEFYNKHNSIIFKPLFNSGQVRQGSDPHYLFATQISEEQTNLPYLEQVPGIFQEYIQKEYDLRLIVTGNSFYPIAIYSQKNKDAAIDWRRANFENLECKLVDIPQSLRRSVSQLIAYFGIHTAAIDFAVDHSGTHYFLDLNPGGRWLQFEMATGAQISDSFALLFTDLQDSTPSGRIPNP